MMPLETVDLYRHTSATRRRRHVGGEAAGSKTHLDGLGVQFETVLLVDEEVQNMLALVALELDHLAELVILNDGAIAGCRAGWRS